jgi:Zn finger protein HypA/HybF involved in hydrogenase expression
MKKYRVCGSVTVSVYKEVWANSEEEAYDKAYEELDTLNEYCGNGSYDRLMGVENDGESVAADGLIEYNDIELLEDDPNHLECPECGEELDEERDGVFYCWECHKYFNADGEEIYQDEDEEEEDEE